jgi:hypothetical protein
MPLNTVRFAFEALLCGSEYSQVSCLEQASAGVEEIYVTSLPWLREQVTTPQTGEPRVSG